jgi:hypothetical protein
MMREHNPYKRMKRKLTWLFIVGGGVLVPIGEDWLAARIRDFLRPSATTWGPDAAAIVLVAGLFVALFGGAQGLLDISFRTFRGVRRWVFGEQWIEGEWIDNIEREDIARSANVQFSYESNGDVKVLGRVIVEGRPLYKFESIKATMVGADLQFMYRTTGPALQHEAFGFACFSFWGERIPVLYTGYFVDTEGLGRVQVEGRRNATNPARSG